MTRKYTWSPEGLAKRRARMKALHADPEVEKRRLEALRRAKAQQAARRREGVRLSYGPAAVPVLGWGARA